MDKNIIKFLFWVEKNSLEPLVALLSPIFLVVVLIYFYFRLFDVFFYEE